jgi:RNA polymerase sigma factor (sigma-70 family)
MSDAGMSEEAFVALRSLLFAVAYEMLGSPWDADDVVQETWLRWARVDQSEVRDPRAYLVRTVQRLALNHLRTFARRREDLMSEWLFESLPTNPDVADGLQLADNVSVALQTVLEALGPTERVVFLLRKAFVTPYDELAESVHKSEAAVRQIVHRARGKVAARGTRLAVSAAERQAAVDRFLAAARGEDLQGLLDVLAPGVVDGAGMVNAPRPQRFASPVFDVTRGSARAARGSPTAGVTRVGSLGAMRVEEHIERLDAESAAFLALARGADLERPVPGCEGWVCRDAIAHVGQLLRWSAELVATRRLEMANWEMLGITTPGDDELVDWLAESRTNALDTLRTADLSAPVWSWAGDHRGWFWPRRMLFEVAVHRTDLQRGVGEEPTLDDDLAAEGIDEHLSLLPWTAVTDPGVAALSGTGETIGLEPPEGPRWRILFVPGGFIWDRTESDTDVTVSGPVFDLYMHTQGRPNQCTLSGDLDLHARTLGSLSF